MTSTVKRVIHIKRFDEIAAAEHRSVEAVERDLFGSVLYFGACQHILQRHANPARIAHRTVGKLPARDPWREETTAVAGTLVNSYVLDRFELGLQLGDGQFEGLAGGIATDLDDMGVDVDRGRDAGIVIPDEEGIVRCDQSVVEDFKRGS